MAKFKKSPNGTWYNVSEARRYEEIRLRHEREYDRIQAERRHQELLAHLSDPSRTPLRRRFFAHLLRRR